MRFNEIKILNLALDKLSRENSSIESNRLHANSLYLSSLISLHFIIESIKSDKS